MTTIDTRSSPAAPVHPLELVHMRTEDPAVRIIDVRTAGEFEAGHIEGSYNVPLDLLDEHVAELSALDHDVVLVCQSGARATKALDQLVAAGKSNLRVLGGGVNAWTASGGPVARTGRRRWAMERQVRLVAGSAVVASLVASIWFPPAARPRRPRRRGPHVLRRHRHLRHGERAREAPAQPRRQLRHACRARPPHHRRSDHPIGALSMFFHQYYLGCLSHASYLIGDETTGRAVVVDPQRDVSEYLADAAAHGLTIELVLETHFHADFLSGHLELAAQTGAPIGFSAVAEPEYEIRKLADGERISLGEVVVEIRHTPGHTPESMSIVVWEHDGDDVPYGVLTGDTLFIGDVGRPDLLTSVGFTREELAAKLYDSLHAKLLSLPDATRVFPAHGAGSACGKNLSTELTSTIGAQRRENYALLAPDRETFVELVTEGQAPAPGYFAHDATLNKQHHALMDETALPAAMNWEQVRSALAAGALLVDGRDPVEFARGHLRGAVNVGLDGRYAEFAGSVVPSDTDIVLFVEPGTELEAKNRLGRIGFDRVLGYVDRPFEVLQTHQDHVSVASRLTPIDLQQRQQELTGLQLVDVRNPGEHAQGAVPGAINIPVGQLPGRLSELDAERPTVVYCAGGYRSSVAASLLRANGFADVSDIAGGYGAWAHVVPTSPQEGHRS